MAISGGDGSIILTTKVDETGLKKGFGSMKKMVATASKAFLAIGAAAAAATVAITKMAVSAYADYEQLVGGVETLFKGSAQKVIDYANDAFYTAGVSANEYMQQVTSFSASLIRSTAGNTDKAADIANMALIDISDNVNKMGSSMESVTLAYQGFAKQQYMLLDNLKLGYGGTKTEMERLLRDAQALTGVKYDINNLADVYSAIHAIQEELGITGTTAKEAEKTITGSANMMKAAWQNVLSAIAGGGDLDRAINNLVYSIQKYFENIVPVVERSLVGIGRLIEKVAPMLIQNVASALIQSIPNLINAIYQMIVGLAKGIYEGIKALFTGKSGSITADVKTSVDGVSSSLGGITSGMEDLGDATEEAGKQAKKSLAVFDDLNILSSQMGSGTQGAFGDSIGQIGGISSNTSMNIQTEQTAEQNNWLTDRLSELMSAFGGLEPIKYEKIGSSLERIWNALSNLANTAWGGLLWLVEKILVPLANWANENILPIVLEFIADRLETIKDLLKIMKPLVKDFYDRFLKPIAEKVGPKIVEFLDNFKNGLKNVEDKFKDSEFWQDFRDVLQKIWDVLAPIVAALFELTLWVIDIVNSHIFNDLTTILNDIGDAIGIIAAIINGDFDEAWKHFKKLLWDNRIEDARQDLELLKGVFDGVIGKIGELVSSWKEKLEEFFGVWKEKISEWWSDDVQPWFTKEKWEEQFSKIGESLANAIVGVGGFVEKWKTNITDWWNDDVAPWFTTAKWKEVFDNIVTSISDFFTAEDGFAQTWKTKISEWWTNEVTPWFTIEKWKELGEHIKDGLVDGFNGAINGIRGIINKILDGFQGLVNGAIDMLNSLIGGWNKVADVTPGLSSIGRISRVDLSKYKLPPLAQGAVLPPNKPFMAIVGDQKHGTNIEAPLQTIVDAFNIALQGNANFGGGNTEVVLEIDGREFGRAVVEQGNRENRRIGTRLVIA